MQENVDNAFTPRPPIPLIEAFLKYCGECQDMAVLLTVLEQKPTRPYKLGLQKGLNPPEKVGRRS